MAQGRGLPITRFQFAGGAEQCALALASSGDAPELTVLFASPSVDLSRLATLLPSRIGERIIGASSSRVFGNAGFAASGVTGFHLPKGRFTAVDTVLEDVATIGLPELRDRVRALRDDLAARRPASDHRFALLLVDAEARSEERLAAVLGMELTGIPLIGGSAGDLYFNPLGHPPGSTRLLHGGVARRGAAILVLISSSTPVAAYCHNHYERSPKRLVITKADPARRLVREIDGQAALAVYARACGFRRVPTESRDFAPYPLMIRIGGNYYPRGMQRIYADGALEFACALEPGLVVSLAKAGNMVSRLENLYGGIQSKIGRPELVIGVDCAARTAFMENNDLTDAIGALHLENAMTGFSSLGEQFNTMHANNSFTCLAIAKHS